jgi:hypothetical protein
MVSHAYINNINLTEMVDYLESRPRTYDDILVRVLNIREVTGQNINYTSSSS